MVPHPNQLKLDDCLLSVFPKTVCDLLLSGKIDTVDKILDRFQRCIKLGTIIHFLGLLRFYGISLIQNEDYTASINADDKPNDFIRYRISSLRPHNTRRLLKLIYKMAFTSINSSVYWLVISVSLLCSEL